MGEGVEAASAGIEEGAGVFRYDVAEDTWWWSDEVFRMHGLAPGEVTPTTELLLEHKHPEDRDYARRGLEACLSDGEPFSCYHRVVAADGRVRRLVAVGDGETDDAGRVTGVRGFFIDITVPVNQQIREVSDKAITAARNSQERIDQARGIVMGVYGVDADAALALLRRHSQHTNTPYATSPRPWWRRHRRRRAARVRTCADGSRPRSTRAPGRAARRCADPASGRRPATPAPTR